MQIYDTLLLIRDLGDSVGFSLLEKVLLEDEPTLERLRSLAEENELVGVLANISRDVIYNQFEFELLNKKANNLYFEGFRGVEFIDLMLSFVDTRSAYLTLALDKI